MPTYDKPTYIALIDDVREDFTGYAELLAKKSDESFQVDILNAEQKIADDFDIKEEYELRLTADVDEYYFRDRPAIISVTNASPMSVATAVAHGLSDQQIISIRGVQGTEAANGSFRIALTDTLNFTLKEFARIVGTTVDGTTVTASTEKPHGWATGDEIVIDSSGGYMDGTFTITVTGLYTFTFTHTVVGEDNGLGIATKDSTGDGAYESGGRFWKEDEIPTHLGRFDFGETVVVGYRQRVGVVSNEEVSDDESWESFWNASIPCSVTEGRNNGNRYLRFSVPPSESRTVRLFGILKITPQLYYDDPVTSPIHLDSEFSEAIKHYMTSKAYLYLKDRNGAKEEMNEFLSTMRSKKLNTVTHKRIRVMSD